MAQTVTTKEAITNNSKLVLEESRTSNKQKIAEELEPKEVDLHIEVGVTVDKKKLFSKEKEMKKKMADKNKKSNSKKEKKSNNNNKKNNLNDHDAQDGNKKELIKPKALVEELKLFQNNQLLNQQDPMQQLQRQLDELMKNEHKNNKKKSKTSICMDKTNGLSNDCYNQYNNIHQSGGLCQANQLDLSRASGSNNNNTTNPTLFSNSSDQMNSIDNGRENISTIKKGILWQQQQYDKFHQRLFCRWKKRYFILTTDYLVCFKRSSSKVGHSEMGKFLYKTSLNDITKVDWLRPNKSDKGAITLQIIGNFNLFLWSKENLVDWMFMIRESIERYKIKKSCVVQNSKCKTISNLGIPIIQQKPSILGTNQHEQSDNFLDNNKHHDDFYENTTNTCQETQNKQTFTITNEQNSNCHLTNHKTKHSKESSALMTRNQDNNSPNNQLSLSNNNLGSKIENATKNSFDSQNKLVSEAHSNGNCETTSSSDSDKANKNQIKGIREEPMGKENKLGLCNDFDVRQTGRGLLDLSSNKATINNNNESSDDDTRERNVKQNSGATRTEITSNQSITIDSNTNSSSRDKKTLTEKNKEPKVDGKLNTTSFGDGSLSSSNERKREAEFVQTKRDDASSGNLSSDRDVTTPSVCVKDKDSSGETSSPSRSISELTPNSPTIIMKSISSSSRDSEISLSSSSRNKNSNNNNNNNVESPLMIEKNLVKEAKEGSFKRKIEQKNDRVTRRKNSSSTERADEKRNRFDRVQEGDRHEHKEQHKSEINGSDDKNKLYQGANDQETSTTKEKNITSSSFDEEKNEKGSSIRDKSSKCNKNSKQTVKEDLTEPIEEVNLRRPMNNMIRRDDSWQSLVSLTRVGKVTPIMPKMQVPQRSLYAQHIMPNESGLVGAASGEGSIFAKEEAKLARQFGGATNKQIISLIESTATPSRNPLFRNMSVQAPRSNRPPLLANQQQYVQPASFDMPNCASNLRQQEQAIAGLSYQQKLLKLQLMHNSNNVDYIRHNGVNADGGDYGIYGPESTTTTNYYGYSSMRSNLKSAASEFSFIRPSPSSYVQSTLPHKPKQRQQNNTGERVVNNDNNNEINLQQQSIRSSIILPKTNSPAFKQQYDDNNNNLNYLINSDHHHKQQQQQLNLNQQFNNNVNPLPRNDMLNLQNGSQLSAPMRELPLKPNKKRNNNLDESTTTNGVPKSSSLTSSIAFFFKRAFSRRSKRNRSSSKRKHSKLNESCSSSVGALAGDFYANVIPVAPSAFSTGSKSVANADNSNQQQSQTMIDMIETFTNKTSENLPPPPSRAVANLNGFDMSSSQFEANRNIYHQQYNKNNLKDNQTEEMLQQTPSNQLNIRAGIINQFGSPLHKSNSISTTMGLSHLVDQQISSSSSSSRAHQFLYDNNFNNELSRAEILAAVGSPMMMRSSKVMSTNLTPNSIVSPKINASRHQEGLLPRPSSIYGQPSMISSPMISRDFDHRNANNNFGLHRNSLHNAHFRDHNRLTHQFSKTQILDTTREVAEELVSPVNINQKSIINIEQDLVGDNLDGGEHHSSALMRAQQSIINNSNGGKYLLERDNSNIITSSPSSVRLQQHHRQAIVNPILQSPTMNTIYDNHPIMLNNSATSADLSQVGYSHYDNHQNNHFIVEQQLQQQQHQNQYKSPLISRSRFGSNSVTQFLPSSPMLCSNDSSQHHNQNYNVKNSGSILTPSRSYRQQQSFDLFPEKPSAIVEPNNSSSVMENFVNYNNETNSQLLESYSSSSRVPALNSKISRSNLPLPPTPSGTEGLNRGHEQQNINVRQNQSSNNSRSPLMSRITNNNLQYQQSPLVGQQSGVIINKRDGLVQATMIESPSLSKGAYSRLSSDDNNKKSRSARSSDYYHDDENCYTQAVINIAGAPGINLEPSLAASLLRGTNINAYTSSTFNRQFGPSSNRAQTNEKTFLVSTRMSKSMAHSQSNDNDVINTTKTTLAAEGQRINSVLHRDEISSTLSSNGQNTSSYAKDLEDSSTTSGSRSINSSESRKSSKSRFISSSQEEQSEVDMRDNDLSVGKRRDRCPNERPSKMEHSGNSVTKKQHFKRKHKREGSFDEQTDDISTSNSASSDKSEEKNWITSKLINNLDE